MTPQDVEALEATFARRKQVLIADYQAAHVAAEAALQAVQRDTRQAQAALETVHQQLTQTRDALQLVLVQVAQVLQTAGGSARVARRRLWIHQIPTIGRGSRSMGFIASLLFPAKKVEQPKIEVPPPPPPPPPPEPPPPPAAMEGQASAGAAAEEQTVKKRRGQSATILTSPLGVTTPGAAQPKTLLGG